MSATADGRRRTARAVDLADGEVTPSLDVAGSAESCAAELAMDCPAPGTRSMLGPDIARALSTPPEPHWLTPEERQAWISLASVVMRLLPALDAQLQRDSGISHFEYQVLAGLSESPERTLRMSVLAGLAEGSLSRLSQVVSRLEKRGWVTRTPDPTDGRYTLATLTESGWEKVVATAPGHVEAVRAFVIDPLTKAQQRQLTDIGARIVKAIHPDDACLSPSRETPPTTS